MLVRGVMSCIDAGLQAGGPVCRTEADAVTAANGSRPGHVHEATAAAAVDLGMHGQHSMSVSTGAHLLDAEQHSVPPIRTRDGDASQDARSQGRPRLDLGLVVLRPGGQRPVQGCTCKEALQIKASAGRPHGCRAVLPTEGQNHRE